MPLKKTQKPVLVLGIGNILLRDEGIGVHVINQMQKIELPEHVELVDGGTAGMDLIDIMAERQKVIIIDAVQTDNEPGTILKFTMDAIPKSDTGPISMHDIGIIETIHMVKMLGCEPKDITFLGIKPKDISCGLDISPDLSSKISIIIELILQEIDGYEGSSNQIS